MSIATRVLRSAALSVLVPVLVMLFLMAVKGSDTEYDVVAMTVSALAGLALLVREWRAWAFVIAGPYLLVMWLVLTGVGIGAACGFHGRCL
jgi:hypothetical protein